jgi:hypothetical protein
MTLYTAQFRTDFHRRSDRWRVAAALLMAAWLVPIPVRADDFPNDVKRTFTTDIPHFFQDDIPCAFGGKPTSGTKTACKGAGPASTHKAKVHKSPSKKSASGHADTSAAGAGAGVSAGNASTTKSTP